MKTILIGAGSDLGVDVLGANIGPRELLKEFDNKNILLERDSNYIKSNSEHDLRKNINEVNKFNSNLYNVIKNEKDFCITIGGDHSISIASGLASIKKYKDLGIIWIDAHLDYNTFKTTITGNLHGLPLASLNKLNQELSEFHDGDYYNPKNTVVVGYRSKEENAMDEILNTRNMGVTVFTTNDIKEMGINKVMDLAFKIATNNYQKDLHISYDLDVIDPKVCEGVSVPEVNGLSELEYKEITKYLKNNKKIIKSFDLVEYNPLNDINNKTKEIAKYIINEIK